MVSAGINTQPQTGVLSDGDNRDFHLWDVSGTYSVDPKFNITAGYFRPHVGRENITAAFSAISFEKSLLNFYPGLFLPGRNTGREIGVNLDGLILKKGWSLNYNFGYFDITN
jgi:hypothetical protein